MKFERSQLADSVSLAPRTPRTPWMAMRGWMLLIPLSAPGSHNLLKPSFTFSLNILRLRRPCASAPRYNICVIQTYFLQICQTSIPNISTNTAPIIMKNIPKFSPEFSLSRYVIEHTTFPLSRYRQTPPAPKFHQSQSPQHW